MTTALFKEIETSIKSNLVKTKKSLKIAVAWFTNPAIFDVVMKLENLGIKIEIILSDDITNFKNENLDFQKLINNGTEIRISKFPNLMHHKFCIIDDRLLISGSYNWTLRAEFNNYENIIISNELNLISQFKFEFENLKKITDKLINISKTKFSNYVTELENNEEIKLDREFEYDTKEMPMLPENNEDQEFGEYIEEQIDIAEQFYLRGKHTEAIETCLEILKKNSNVSIAYEIIATSKWRQKKYNEQIEYAQKAVEIDNQNFSAYNMLGVGYSHISNAQKSIDNYFICIREEPEEYVYYRNRAISYLELENDYKIPKTLREQFAKKANLDLHTVIELCNKFEFMENCYELYYSRGVAYLNLNKVNAAKEDLQKAIDLYEKGDKKTQDINQYKEIKQALKEIKRN